MTVVPDREAEGRARIESLLELARADALSNDEFNELVDAFPVLVERVAALERERDALKAAERSHYKTAIENMHKLEGAEVRVAQLEEALRRVATAEQGFMDARQFFEFLQRQAGVSVGVGPETAK